MTRINLLPWRDELRKQKQREFIFVAVGAVVIMLGVMFLVHLTYENKIQYQKARNTYLEGEIAALDKKIKEIESIEREKSNLLARMNIIQQLQSSRPQVVHTFDELVTTLPDGIYLTSITNENDNLTMNGVAQSNARVSSYMRAIDNSEWLTKPRLTIIETSEEKKSDRNQRISKFILHASQKSTKQEENNAEGGQ
jgi:type IV pilus assembly protein PilN